MAATVATKAIALFDFDSSDWPIIWSWIKDYYWRVADDYAPKTMQEFVESQTARESKKFGVYRGNELVGLIMFDHLSPVACECHVYFKRAFWGWENTMPAMEMAKAWCFGPGGYEKNTSPVFATNRLMIRMLKRLGAIEEGYLRKHTRQRGKLVDVVMLSVFKGD